MTLAELKELFDAQGVEYTNNITLAQAKKLAIDNFGSMEDATRTYQAQKQVVVDNGGSNAFESFMAKRKGSAATEKITTREGTGGKNPYLVTPGEYVGEVMKCELHAEANGDKKAVYKFQIAVKGISLCTAYGNRPFEVDDLVMIECRVLEAGVYMDADKDGNQRELVVPTGRKLAYSPTFGVKAATVNRVLIAKAMNVVAAD